MERPARASPCDLPRVVNASANERISDRSRTEPRDVCPQRDSNPRYGLERAATWTASRWGPAASISAVRGGSRPVLGVRIQVELAAVPALTRPGAEGEVRALVPRRRQGSEPVRHRGGGAEERA